MESQYQFIRSLLKEQENVLLQLDELNSRIEAVLLTVAPPKHDGDELTEISETTICSADSSPSHSHKAA